MNPTNELPLRRSHDDGGERGHDAERRNRGRNQLIWQIIASQCKQGGSICLAARRRDASGAEDGQRRVSGELGWLGGWISKGKTRDINPRRRHELSLSLSLSLFLCSQATLLFLCLRRSSVDVVLSAAGNPPARIYRRRNQTPVLRSVESSNLLALSQKQPGSPRPK